MHSNDLTRRLGAEFLGTAFLLATIAGSGIMAETLFADQTGGQAGAALLPHSLAIGAILFVMITLLGPVSGAHFNPAVSLAFVLRGEIGRREASLYMVWVGTWSSVPGPIARSSLIERRSRSA